MIQSFLENPLTRSIISVFAQNGLATTGTTIGCLTCTDPRTIFYGHVSEPATPGVDLGTTKLSLALS